MTIEDEKEWERIGTVKIKTAVVEALKKVCAERCITVEEYIAMSVMEEIDKRFAEIEIESAGKRLNYEKNTRIAYRVLHPGVCFSNSKRQKG